MATDESTNTNTPRDISIVPEGAVLGADGVSVDGNPDERDKQHVGRDGQGYVIGGGAVGEAMLDIRTLEERFLSESQIRMKPSTQKQYLAEWRKFCRTFGIVEQVPTGQYRKKDGKARTREVITIDQKRLKRNARKMLLDYLGGRPDGSLPHSYELLKGVWERVYGKDTFPIDAKRDLPKSIGVQRGATPQDNDVVPWVRSVENEYQCGDPYKAGYVGTIIMLGVRKELPGKIRWKDIVYVKGRPDHINIPNGKKRDLKTGAALLALIPPLLADILIKWRDVSKGGPEDLVFPFVRIDGTITKTPMDGTRHHNLWVAYTKKWNLPHLTSRAFRHYAASTAAVLRMTPAVRALAQGHTINSHDMGEYYDNRGVDKTLDELRELVPNGFAWHALGPDYAIESKDGTSWDAAFSPVMDLADEYLKDKIKAGEALERLIEWKAGIKSQKLILPKEGV